MELDGLFRDGELRCRIANPKAPTLDRILLIYDLLRVDWSV